MKIDRKKVGWFLCITFVINWILAGAYYLFVGKGPNTVAFTVMAALYMFVPALSAVIVQKYMYKQPIQAPLRLRFKLNRWYIVGWLVPPVLATVAMLVALLFPGVTLDLSMLSLLERYADFMTTEQLAQARNQIDAVSMSPIVLILVMIAQGLVAGVTINAIAGLGEELGWRGFLLRETECLGFWKSSWWIGIIWGIWHAPLILQGHNYPDHPVLGVFMMVIFTLLLSPLFTFVTRRANSVLAPAIMHGTLNATAGLSFIFLKGGNSLLVGLTGLAGFIVLAAANLILFVFANVKDD